MSLIILRKSFTLKSSLTTTFSNSPQMLLCKPEPKLEGRRQQVETPTKFEKRKTDSSLSLFHLLNKQILSSSQVMF